jgi:hypothetical protein
LGGGSKGRMRSHKASSTNGFAMCSPPVNGSLHMVYRAPCQNL